MTTAGWNYRGQDWREDRSQIELYWNKISNQSQFNIIELDRDIKT